MALALLPAAASAQATRTWVSGVGDDVNPCSRTAPCKTFAGAISKTAADGIINAIDPGGYGAVTVTKGITLDGAGTNASILASGTSGIVVNAPGKDVIVRNLAISGTGTPECSGVRGIQLLDARSLLVEGVTIDNFATAGINVAPGSGNTSVVLRDTRVNQGCGTGVGVALAPGGAFAVSAMLDGVTLTNLATGLSVGDRGHATALPAIALPPRLSITPEPDVNSPVALPKIVEFVRRGGRRRITCRVTQARAAAVSARLASAGRTVATGRGTSTVVLSARRALAHGSYRMTLRSAGRTVRLTVRL